jgi:hypothetical protein
MSKCQQWCGLSLPAVFLVALSLSIGWGIRGDFGHESGSMVPGALAAIAVCLLSGREDWHRRVHYFALFGGLAWGFGGSIAYMYGISFAGSEEWRTCWYGFFATFLIGGLWAGLGGAGTALPAVLNRKQLRDLVVPLCFVLAMMFVGKVFLEEWAAELLKTKSAEGMDGTWSRHKSPLYWFDADWFPAMSALAGVCLFDLWDRRFGKAVWLVVFSIAGTLGGRLAQWLMNLTGASAAVARVLVVPLGDTTAINPATGHAFSPDNLMTNWPQFFGDFPQHLGASFGLLIGIAVYFTIFGKWRRGSKLFLYLSLGWLIAFMVMPVFGTIPLRSIGGFRLTPPRSDDWAGILGVFIAMVVYCARHKKAPVALAGSISFVLGGLSFATVPFVRSILRLPGHAARLANGPMPDWLKHYHSANWHSFLEQWHGFGHGIAIAVAIGILAIRLRPVDEPAEDSCESRSPGRWQDVFAVGFVLFFITLMNVYKNPPEWVKAEHMPAMMKMPLVAAIEWSAGTWFMIAWLAISVSAIALMSIHLRRPLAVVPASWVGRGQLMFIILLWIMVIANFERALSGFTENRLITEWVLFMNAAIATFLVVALPGKPRKAEVAEPPSYWRLTGRTWALAAPVVAVLLTAYAFCTLWVYKGQPVEGAPYNHKRWGAEAHWRIKPILKNEEHR